MLIKSMMRQWEFFHNILIYQIITLNPLDMNFIGCDIHKMLEFLKTGFEIKVDEERENIFEIKITNLDMSNDQIAVGLQVVFN